MTELKFENLTKTYGKKAALDNFSCTLTDGVYGLLGPNGAGKTTLINIIVKLIRQNGGSVYLNEKNINFLYKCYKHRNDFKIEWQSDDLNTVICFHTENNLPIKEKITVLPSENRILIEKIN